MYGYFSKNNGVNLSAALTAGAERSDAPCGLYFDSELVKFPEDHFILEDAAVKIAVCGYVLNHKRVLSETGKKTLFEALSDAYAESPERAVTLLRGAYLVAIYDKAANSLLLFNDKLSKLPVYTYQNGGDFLFSTSFFGLVDALKRLKAPITIDPLGVAMMTATGVLWEDTTYVNEIKYLRPYRYLTVGGAVREHCLPFPALNRQVNADEAIERVDALFTDAVRLQYEKNAGAGYRQFASLSGGMDSRCVMVRAYQLGFADDLAFTYAQSDSLDQQIAQRVAAHYGAPHLFYSMDNGGFILDRDAFVAANEGQMTYCGSTGVLPVVSALRCERFGILHSGISGGEIMGDIIPAEGDDTEGDRHLDALTAQFGCPSKEHMDAFRRKREEYPTFNVFRQLNDLRANTNLKRTVSPYVEVASPYLYEDLYEYLMTVPISIKGFRKLYYAWVKKHLAIPFRTTDASLTSVTGTLAERYARITLRKAQARLGRLTKYDMNPFDYWEKINPKIGCYVEARFAEDRAALDVLDPALSVFVDQAFASKTGRDRLSVITATWALAKILN